MSNFNGLFFIPLLGLFFTIIPLVVTVWMLLKIQSIDATLREISVKLDRLPRDHDKTQV